MTSRPRPQFDPFAFQVHLASSAPIVIVITSWSTPIREIWHSYVVLPQ